MKTADTIEDISRKQIEFLAGCMLGDGYITTPATEKANCDFVCSHGESQSEYNKYKQKVLESLGSKYYEYTRKTPSKVTGKFYSYNMVITNKSYFLKQFRKQLYIDGKKTITEEFLNNYFTEYSLAILFMDDGNKTKPKVDESQASYCIATCGFDRTSVEVLRKFLQDKFNIETTQTKDNRIYIRINSRNLFEYLIKDYIKEVPSMKYKLRNCVS